MRRLRQWGLGALALALCAATAAAKPPEVTPVPGKPALLLGSYDVASFGYKTSEYFVSGTATSYKLPGPPTEGGKWDVTPGDTAPYKTRVVVVRPADPKKFNGTVVVEWLNVTAGTDATPDWNAAHRLLVRQGYAYVGVSAQKVGIDGAANPGGMAIGTALKKADPARYGSLVHPGDAWSYDIYSQVGRLLKAPHASGLLGPLVSHHVLAAGEFQSAGFMTTYINAVDRLAKVYDGFLVHSRSGGSSSLGPGNMGAPAGGPAPTPLRAVKFRPDLRVPVITVITETDLIGYYAARRPDDAHLRVWEVPGTSHADAYTFGVGMTDTGREPVAKLAAGYEPSDTVMGTKLAKPINFAPQHHYLVSTALAALNAWVATGKAPPHGPLIKVDASGASPKPVVDDNGDAVGGIRTPWVDAPTAILAGAGNSGSPFARLAGVGDPFDRAKLDRIYPGGKAEYLRRFRASLDAAIKAGFILPADRAEILGLADAAVWRGSK